MTGKLDRPAKLYLDNVQWYGILNKGDMRHAGDGRYRTKDREREREIKRKNKLSVINLQDPKLCNQYLYKKNNQSVCLGTFFCLLTRYALFSHRNHELNAQQYSKEKNVDRGIEVTK